MSDDKPSAKWEAKQRAAKEAEAKFEANQARAKGRKPKKSELDEVGEALGTIEQGKVGVLGWLVAHKKAVIVAVLVLASCGVVFAMCKVVAYQLRNAPGTPTAEVFVAGTGTLILIDHVEVGGKDSKGNQQASSGKGERLTAIDVSTGKQLAVSVTDYKECWAGSTRLICANIYDQVELLEPINLELRATAAELIAEAKLAKPTRRYQPDGDAVIVVLEDGRGARIETSPLSVKVLETVESSSRFPPSSTPSCGKDSRFKLDATKLIFESGTRNKLTSDPPPPAESAAPSGPALTYLDGGFLRGSSIPLVLGKQSLDKPEQVIARVDGISKERWSVALGGACREAWSDDHNLYVATGNPGQRAIAIELETGRVLWTFGR